VNEVELELVCGDDDEDEVSGEEEVDDIEEDEEVLEDSVSELLDVTLVLVVVIEDTPLRVAK
jgi:hypothetical protein